MTCFGIFVMDTYYVMEHFNLMQYVRPIVPSLLSFLFQRS